VSNFSLKFRGCSNTQNTPLVTTLVVVYLNMTLLQIYHWVCRWKNFENRLIFAEVMGKSLVSCFFDSRCRFSFRTYCQHCSATARCGLLLQMSHVPWYLCLSVGHGRAWALQKRWTDRVTRCHLGRLTQAQGTMYWTEGPDWPHLANTTERSVLDAA